MRAADQGFVGVGAAVPSRSSSAVLPTLLRPATKCGWPTGVLSTTSPRSSSGLSPRHTTRCAWHQARRYVSSNFAVMPASCQHLPAVPPKVPAPCRERMHGKCNGASRRVTVEATHSAVACGFEQAACANRLPTGHSRRNPFGATRSRPQGPSTQSQA